MQRQGRELPSFRKQRQDVLGGVVAHVNDVQRLGPLGDRLLINKVAQALRAGGGVAEDRELAVVAGRTQ